MNSDRGGGSEFTAIPPPSSRRNGGALQNIESAILNLVQSKRTYPTFVRTMMFKNHALHSKFKTAIYRCVLLLQVHFYWTHPIGMLLLLLFLELQSISILVQVYETRRPDEILLPDFLKPLVRTINHAIHFEFLFDLSLAQNTVIYCISFAVVFAKLFSFLKLELEDTVKTRKSRLRQFLMLSSRWIYIIFLTVLFSSFCNLLSKPAGCIFGMVTVARDVCISYSAVNITSLVVFVLMVLFSTLIELLTYDRGVHTERLWVRKNSRWMVYWKLRIAIIIFLVNSNLLNESLIFLIGLSLSIASFASVDSNTPYFCRKKTTAIRNFVVIEILIGFAFLAKSLADGSGLAIDLRYLLVPVLIALVLFILHPDRKNITLEAIQVPFGEISTVEVFINKLEQTRFVLRNYHKSEEYNEYLHGMLEVFAEESGPQRRRKLLTVSGALDPQTFLQEEMREFIRNLSDKYIWGIQKFNGNSDLVISYCFFLRETDSTSSKSKRIQESLAIVEYSFFTSFDIYCLK